MGPQTPPLDSCWPYVWGIVLRPLPWTLQEQYELSQVFRQTDSRFISILNKIREGVVDEAAAIPFQALVRHVKMDEWLALWFLDPPASSGPMKTFYKTPKLRKASVAHGAHMSAIQLW